MAKNFEPHARERNQTPVSPGYLVWCPFCDEWTLTDSIVARKKLGMHIGSKHPEEVRFKRGVQPPKIVVLDEIRKVSNDR